MTEENRFQKAVENLKVVLNRAVFSTNRDRNLQNGKDPKDPRARLSTGERQALNNLLSYVHRIANNNFPQFKHVGHRCKALDDLAIKFKTGFPWKNNLLMLEIATPILVSHTEAISHRLMEIEKVKYGKDVGTEVSAPK